VGAGPRWGPLEGARRAYRLRAAPLRGRFALCYNPGERPNAALSQLVRLPQSPFILAVAVLAALVALGLVALSWRTLAGLSRPQRLALTAGRLLLFAVAAVGVADLGVWRASSHTLQPYLALLIDASQSMSIADEAGGQTRLEAALAQCQAQRLPDQLGTRAAGLTYSFAEAAHPTQNMERLQAKGQRTDLVAAVSAPVEQIGPQDLAALVLVCDGQDTEGASAADIAGAAQGVPVYTVGVGKPERPRDLELAQMLAPKEVARGEQAVIAAQLRAYGYQRVRTRVLLRRGDERIEARAAELSPGQPARLQFRLTPRELGLFRYSLRAEPLADELSSRNNERNFFLRVTQADRKVLVLDRPRQEFAALRRALEPVEKLSLTIYLKKDRASGFWREQPSPQKDQPLPRGDKLAQYDAVIIGDLASADLGREVLAEIASLVRSKGLGLALLGGPQGMGKVTYAGTPLADLLPFSAAAGSYQAAAAQARISQAGQNHPALAAVHGDLNLGSLPALAGLYALGSLRPGAQALLTANLPARGAVPLVAVRRVGSAKVLAVATDSTWRWVRSEHAGEQSAAAHAALWRALIWWLATIEAEHGVLVQLDRDTYTVGDAVRIVVTVRDQDFAPVSDAQVTAVVQRPDGAKDQVNCYAVPDASGRYEGTYRTGADGTHKLTVKAQRGAADLGSAAREFAVEPQVEEFRHPEMNRGLLEDVARRTRAAYLPLSRVAELPKLIQPQPRRIASAERTGLAHTRPYLLLFLALAALDWGLRRRWGVG